MNTLLLFLGILNLTTFFIYWHDKKKARRGKWRTPESTLLLLALCGGSYGAWCSMTLFRHKTKHWKFRILVPLFAILHSILIVWFVDRGWL